MKKELKGFICGAIVGSIGLTTVSAAVEQFILTKADYPVKINGAAYSDPDAPLLNYNGTTYAPMRSMLTAAGLYVDFVDGTAVVSGESNSRDNISEISKTENNIESNNSEGDLIYVNSTNMFNVNGVIYNDGYQFNNIAKRGNTLFLSTFTCTQLIAIINNSFSANEEKVDNFSQGTMQIFQAEYGKWETVQITPTVSNSIFTIVNGNKSLKVDKGQYDDSNIILDPSDLGYPCISVEYVKSQLGIDFDYTVDDENKTITFSNIRNS